MLHKQIEKTLKEIYVNCNEEQVNRLVNIIEKYAISSNLDKFYVAYSFKELLHGNLRAMYYRLEIYIFKPRATLILSSIEKKDLNLTISLLEDLFKEFI